MHKPNSEADKYIAGFPAPIREMLESLRSMVLQAAPEAEEVISYGMPAFKKAGILVWIGGHKNHVGLYPKAAAIEHFRNELEGFKTSKGAIQFPAGQPIPGDLVARIVQFRILEDTAKSSKTQSRIHLNP